VKGDQILNADEDRRRRHAMGLLTQSKSNNRGRNQKHKSPKKPSDTIISPTATTRSIRATLQMANIKTFMTPVRNATEQTAEVINIPTTDTAKLRDADNVDEAEPEHEPIQHQINTLTTATSVDDEKAETMETTNDGIEIPTTVDEPATAPEETIVVPIVPTALGTAPQALLMMAATASVVDVSLIKPPPAQTEVEIRDIPVAKVILTIPLLQIGK
jgi:hypothetical protein